MPITVQQLKQFAASLGHRRLATPARGNQFTVEVEPTRISFIPVATSGRQQECDTYLSHWCSAYNRHKSLDRVHYSFSRNHSYMIPFLEAFIADRTR